MIFRGILSGLSFQEILIQIAYLIPIILISLSFHEAAHAYAAFRAGDPTARNLGRMSLDPLRHLDPLGTLMIFLVGFGWAKPVPVNPRNFKSPHKDEIWVSIAGILTNLALAFVFTFLYMLFVYNGWIRHEIVRNIFTVMITLNIALAIFNLIPLPPLDGYQLVRAIFTGADRFYYRISRYRIWIMIGLLMFISRTNVFTIAIGAVYGLFISFFSAIFGLFY